MVNATVLGNINCTFPSLELHAVTEEFSSINIITTHKYH